MEKILDYLNGRNYKLNSIDGSIDALYDLLSDNPLRIEHTEGVVRKVYEIINSLDLSSELYDKCIQAAYLHDIGYSNKFKFADFHAYDGFVYLKENGWVSEIYKTALFHSFSDVLAEMSRGDLTNMYTNEFLTSEENLVVDIVTFADLHTLPNGANVDFSARKLDVLERYGVKSYQYLHLERIEESLYELVNSFNNHL